jgi:hypothetical protein
VLLESGGLTEGHEAVKAHELWAAALREATRMHTPLDRVWLDGVLSECAGPRTKLTRDVNPARGWTAARAGSVERSQDWGEAPDVIGFVGRAEELATLREWVLEECCRLAAVLGMSGIGKAALASRLALDAAPSFQRLYWRSLRDALPAGEWMAGAIGFLSGHHLVPRRRASRHDAPCCSHSCEISRACSCSTTLKLCSSRVSKRGAIEMALPDTAHCCKPLPRQGTRAAWW